MASTRLIDNYDMYEEYEAEQERINRLKRKQQLETEHEVYKEDLNHERFADSSQSAARSYIN